MFVTLQNRTGVTGLRSKSLPPCSTFSAAYSSPAYTPFPSRPSSVLSNDANDVMDTDVILSTNSSRWSRHYELVPGNEFDDAVASTVRQVDKSTFSTCVEMAVLQATSEARKSARTTLRNDAQDGEERFKVANLKKIFFLSSHFVSLFFSLSTSLNLLPLLLFSIYKLLTS